MGIYNCADTLEEAVQCIIDQTYTNWELIMCDDGSSDNTYSVALSLSQNDDRIKVIKNEKNMTLAPTLNRCIELAKGEYIARMDADDVCDKTRFQKEYDFLEAHKEYAFVSCLMDLFDDEGTYRVINYHENPTVTDLVKKSQFSHAASMMRANALKDVGCYSIEKIHNRVEDYHLWIKFYEKGYKGYNIQEVLYSMRDDINAFHRRSFNNRVNESYIKKYICDAFNLSVKYRIYSLVPIAKFFVPNCLYKFLHKNKK